MDEDNDKSIVIEGEQNTRMASILALRTALKIEATTTMRMSRGRSARSIAQRLLGLEGKPTTRTVYKKLNEFIVEQLGSDFDRPLP